MTGSVKMKTPKAPKASRAGRVVRPAAVKLPKAAKVSKVTTGLGYSKSQCEGPLRMSGAAKTHRVGGKS